ncbi:MAG: AAA-like domain-containing protein [Cyanobacteria bacterium J06643_13]
MSSFERVLDFTDSLVYTQTQEHLNDLQRVILKECWENSKKTYDNIATEYDYSANYIKQGVGPKLWRLLSQATGEKVTKSNFHSVLERQLSKENLQATKNRFSQQNKVKKDNFPANSKAKNEQQEFPALELPIDNVPLNSPFYIERIPHEAKCYAEIVRPGAFIRIKAPRQMGKSSLMYRILHLAQQQGDRTALIHFQQAETSVLSDLERFLRWFCANLAQQLNISSSLEEYWDEVLGAKMSCTAYLQEYILEKIDSHLVIALEEVNEIIEHPQVAREFLTLLRFWHEKTKTDLLWRKLKLIMVHSTEIYIPLNINQSPLNVGLRIELEPFDRQQIVELAQRHQLALSSQELTQLITLVGGFPYLTRKALYHLAEANLTLNELLETAPTDAGIYSNHLQRHLRNIESHLELVEALILVLKSSQPIKIEQVIGFKLHSMGLIKYCGNKVSISCGLYQAYFGDRLINS